MTPDFSAAVEEAKARFDALKPSLHSVEDLKSAIVDIIKSNLDIALPESYQVYMTYSGSTGSVNGIGIARAATAAAPETVANIEMTAAGIFLNDYADEFLSTYQDIVAGGYPGGAIPAHVLENLEATFNNTILFGRSLRRPCRERPAKAFSLGREADIIGRVSSRLP